MALTTIPDDKRNPTAFRVTYTASNGYKLPQEESIFHNRAKVDKRLEELFAQAKSRNLEATATVTPLYKDKDTGLLLPSASGIMQQYTQGRR